jgi:hypothetical protein
VAGLHFDAAIDCDWKLHCYEEDPITKKSTVPIELYCFDRPGWDIRMCYQNRKNDQPKKTFNGSYYTYHTEVDMAEIIKETEKWIEEEVSGIKKPVNNNEEDRNTLF